MRILFDQGVPAPLRRDLPHHSIDTAAERGWSELSNGGLLDEAETASYELLITTDQSMRYQQNLDLRPFGVLVLMGTAWPDVQRRMREIRAAIDRTAPGRVIEVEI